MPQVFITGGTGWVGSAIIEELLSHGYKVLALARSDASAAKLKAQGAEILKGDISDAAILRQGAASSDASIHTAFPVSFDDFVESCTEERAALQALAEGVAGTQKPVIMTTGTGAMAPLEGLADRPAEEYDEPLSKHKFPISERVKTEEFVLELARDKGIRAMVVRLAPTVHGKGDVRFITEVGNAAKKHGKAIYVSEGKNRWPAIHQKDAAVLYRLAVEKGKMGGIYHATAEEGIPIRDVMEAIGKKVGIESGSGTADEARNVYGNWLGTFLGFDGPISSQKTREELGWKPTGLGLLEDIERNYF